MTCESSLSLPKINKVFALSGLTIFALSFFSQIKFTTFTIKYNSRILCEYALWMLTIHGSYSLYTYLDRYFGDKTIAMFFGSCGVTSLWLIKLGFVADKFIILSLIFGVIHFYLME